MSSPALAYAYLRAAYGNDVRNPIDALKPLIKRAFLKNPRAPLNRESVRDRVAELFGIDIPLNVISYVNSALFRDEFIERRVIDRKFIVKNIKDIEDFKILEETAQNLFDSVCQHIDNVLSFAPISGENGESIIEQWLDSSAIGFIGHGAKAYAVGNREIRLNQLMYECLTNDTDGTFLNNITELAIGDVLFQSIKSVTEYEKDFIEAFNRRMSNVRVFFDTKFLLNILGCSDPEFQTSSEELISLCKQTSCKIMIFEHTIFELENIISTVANKLASNIEIDGDIAAFVLDNGFSAGDLMDFSASVRDKLIEMGFEIDRYEDITVELSVDESDLDRKLEQDLRQKNVTARMNDIRSLTGIFRLRGGKGYTHLEDCEAIFITTNKGLSDSSVSFFGTHFREEGIKNRVQLCMTDVVFATRLWTKLPTSVRALPKSQIVTHIIGNLRPSKALRDQLIQNLQNLVEKGEYSNDQLSVIKLSRFTDRLLATEFEYTKKFLSDQEIISSSNEIIRKFRDWKEAQKNILDEEKSRELHELKDELDRIKKRRGEIGDDLGEGEIGEEISRVEAARKIKRSIERNISVVLKVINCCIIFIVVIAVIFQASGIVGMDSIISWVVSIFLSSLTLFGLSSAGLVDRVSNSLSRLLVNYLLRDDR